MCFPTILKYISMCLFIQYFLLNNHCYYKHMALLCHLAANAKEVLTTLFLCDHLFSVPTFPERGGVRCNNLSLTRGENTIFMLTTF